jgi:TetR/AcrR family transcriptional repressor of mexJK operon
MNTSGRQRGRPKSDSKRRQIFGAAIRLFMSQGYEGTRVEQIAGLAGVSKQTIYSHFKDKDDLYQAAITYVCEQLGMPEGLAEDKRDPIDVLTEIGTAFLALLMSDDSRNLYKLVVANADSHPDVAATFYNAGPRTFIDRLAQYLERKTSEGILAIDNPQVAASQFFSMIRGELHMRAILGIGPEIRDEELTDYVTSCARFFVRGYR